MDEDEALKDRNFTLHSGEALTFAESREITRARESSLVVVLGSPESGKTTLIASLFHRFQKGQFANHFFAGSKTCVGLDRRCHLGRTISRGTTPKMDRTKTSEERRLLHLSVRPVDLKTPAKDMLITDISGEEYDDIRHSLDDCRNFDLLLRADHIVILVDGKRIANPQQKHSAKTEATNFISLLLDAGHLHSNCAVYLLVAKCDLIKDDANTYATQMKAYIGERFGSRISNLYIGDIAARPVDHTVEYSLGHGLETPFTSWLQRSSHTEDYDYGVNLADCCSEFDRFFFRQPSEFLAR